MKAKGTTQSHNNMTRKYLRNSLLPIAVIEINELGKALISALPNPGNQSTRNVRLGKKNYKIYRNLRHFLSFLILEQFKLSFHSIQGLRL